MRHAYLFLLWILTPAVNADTDEHRSTLDDQRSMAVTVYNDDLALVKETRGVVLDKGLQRLAVRDVSARMRPETALLRGVAPTNPLQLLEQNFDFDLLTPSKLLEKYIGRQVTVVTTHPTTGQESSERAEVLSTQEGVVLKIGNRIETGFPGRIVFDSVPPNLRDRPTLSVLLHSDVAGKQDVELSYLTGGLAWQADYVAELAANDGKLDLNGWITLTNRSGAAYRDAKLQLVAGDVNRVRDEIQLRRRTPPQMDVMASAEAAVTAQPLFEYHLYSLARPTTLADNQTKQVSLLSATQVPTTKELVLAGEDAYYRAEWEESERNIKVDVYLEFENTKAAHLGMPLPKGIVRVYKKDDRGTAQFVGEDRIDHTPEGEKLRLHLGKSFDVTAERRQTDFVKRPSARVNDYAFESAYEIILKNAKREAATVIVREPVPGQWKVLKESAPHEKTSASIAQWRIDVPPQGRVKLQYRVLVQF